MDQWNFITNDFIQLILSLFKSSPCFLWGFHHKLLYVLNLLYLSVFDDDFNAVLLLLFSLFLPPTSIPPFLFLIPVMAHFTSSAPPPHLPQVTSSRAAQQQQQQQQSHSGAGSGKNVCVHLFWSLLSSFTSTHFLCNKFSWYSKEAPRGCRVVTFGDSDRQAQ